ncbi:hypothetical protein AMTR_s00017p00238050 [Amborella trichopoda]|uniref:Pectinesterase n=1 Tax=Amborella trichopoda TaxID=13333 RepID=W1PM25_AMBTC|nr:hypothetical protein AMTR_s00017p00238050 [Amborella trichopoda]
MPLNDVNEEERTFMKEMADIDRKAKGDLHHGSQRRSCYGKEATCLDGGFHMGNANGTFSGQNATVPGHRGLDSGDNGRFSSDENWFYGDQGRFLGGAERRVVYVEGKVGGWRSLDSIAIEEEDGDNKESEFRQGLRPNCTIIARKPTSNKQNLVTGEGSNWPLEWPSYHVITDAKTVEKFTLGEFIQGGEWLKATGVAYTEGP